MATKKYRPYFTLPELESLRDSLAVSLTSHPSIANLHSYLHKYILDITHGVRKENHTLLPSKAESLGLDSPSDPENPSLPEKSDRLLYESYLSQASTFVNFTPAQITRVQAYRYLQGLMSQEEEFAYEQSELTK